MNGKAAGFTSDEIKGLAQKAKILDLHNHKSIEQKYRVIIRAADKEARLLKREELTTLSQKSKINIQIVESVQDHADVLVEGAKQKLLEGNPELVEPGGALFPAERANSCSTPSLGARTPPAPLSLAAVPAAAAEAAAIPRAATRAASFEAIVVVVGGARHNPPSASVCPSANQHFQIRALQIPVDVY